MTIVQIGGYAIVTENILYVESDGEGGSLIHLVGRDVPLRVSENPMKVKITIEDL